MLRIAEAREAKGWTQEQLANELGTTQATIQRWESGKVDPQLSKIEAISKALGVTLSFLLCIEEHEASYELSLSPDERELLRLYRTMSPEYRAMMVKNAVAYAEMTSKSERRDCGHVERAGRAVR